MQHRKFPPVVRHVIVAGALGLSTAHALAQSAQPGGGVVYDLGTIVLEGETKAEALDRKTESFAGAADVIGRESYAQIPNPTVADALAATPGVVVQEFFGSNDQPRFQIRGSGIQQSPTERGLLILNNGMPVNRADGSYIVGLASPGNAAAIEVWRGGAANRLGATVLGGALNFVSPTASSDPGTKLSFNYGSFDNFGAHGQTSVSTDRAKALFQLELSHKDGFRDINNRSERYSFSANAQFQLTENATTQLVFSYTDLEFDVPGPLTKAALNVDPSLNHPGPVLVGPGMLANPGPNVFRDLPRRSATQFLVGTRTTIDVQEHRFDIGLSATQTDDSFRFPIAAGERVTDGWDATLTARYAYRPDAINNLPLVEATLNYAYGEADRDYFHNVSGNRGPQFGANDLEASTFTAHLGANIPLSQTVVLSPSVSYAYATRQNTDAWPFATRPTVAFNPMSQFMLLPQGTVPTVSNSYDLTYSGWSPRLAITWKPHEAQTVWAAYSRSFEPPTHDDLLATSGGTPFSGPGRPLPPVPTSLAPAFTTAALRAQEADTYELGWRGETASGTSWDVTAYHSLIDNEILSLRDATASPRGSVNAGRTTHTGLEAGLSGRISNSLSGRIAWTYQDFRFDNDPLRGNNRLGGAPRHLIEATLAWEANEVLTLYGSLRWVPEKTPVDNLNTLFASPYAVADIRAVYRLSNTAVIQAGVTNIFDEKYASSTLVVDQARPDQAAFIPGEPRAFYIGASLDF